MDPNDLAKQQCAQEGELIDSDGKLVLPAPAPSAEQMTPRPGVLDFLESRWTFAESSDVAARRAILLLGGTVLTLLLALVIPLILVGILVAALAEHLPAAALALIPLLGGGGAAITIYRRQR